MLVVANLAVTKTHKLCEFLRLVFHCKFFHFWGCSMAMSVEEKLQIGPKSGVTYPLQVVYCGNCTMPIEVRFCYPLIFVFNFDFVTVLRVLPRIRQV